MKKEEQELLPDKEMECGAKRNVQENSAEAFKREMTLVYLMLKGEFSGENMDCHGDSFAIKEAMLSPACKVRSVKIQVDNERMKVPLPAAVKLPEEIQTQIKAVKCKAAGVMPVKLAAVRMGLKEVKPMHVSIPAEPNAQKEIKKLHYAIEHKGVEVFRAKPADISVRLKEIECTKITVPSVPKELLRVNFAYDAG